MCGIAGIISSQSILSNQVPKMIASMKHRGPDDEGFHHNKQISIGQSRLSIIDLSGGHQPMYSDDNTLVLAFNGEIYNYVELRVDLIKKGYIFNTQSDSEVLIHLYKEYGKDMLDLLNGMFVFSIIDYNKEEVFFARDRIGIKPLYYFWKDGMFAFASEIQGLTSIFEIKKNLTINMDAVWHYFSLLYIPQPLTIYNELHVFPAGNYATVSFGAKNISIVEYWRPVINEKKYNSIEECADKLQALIYDAVKLRMRSDVPYGAYLSGGVDSTMIVANMTNCSSDLLKTFTARVHDSDLDEHEYALEASKKFGTIHTIIDVHDIDFDTMAHLISFFGQPFADSSIFPTYLISKKIRGYVTVVLGGDGGDELFSGYDKYSALLEDDSDVTVKKSFINRVPDEIKEQLFTKKFLAKKKKDTYSFLCSHTHNQNYKGHDLMRFLDVEYFLKSDILEKVDHMSMANSLEARVPLLDHRIIEFALGIPNKFLVSKTRNKVLLKHLLERQMSKEFVNRQKIGFMLPIASWLRDFSDNILDLPCVSELEHVFDKEALSNMIRDYKQGDDKYGNILFAYIVFCYWTSLHTF
ncbi:MAG: asparagine synthase (glutamine-hydrolyzing) [Candidatus Magasanikbacteria bacterium]|jgi:asparagine synthase (glutamine-hydrolysing)|nr:asparagine synthase (glutamine-hydrolyzing) [Candidatus Magasanikbacteria bacterium]MBT4071556.1 asparagine synthase (glutamine-hydrolyzing) [Candidatus Magasanikbacteria bacterium]